MRRISVIVALAACLVWLVVGQRLGGGPAPQPGPYVVLLDLPREISGWDEQAAAVVWSPTANELTVPATLAPTAGEHVLLLAPNEAGMMTARWLRPGDARLWPHDSATISGPDDAGRLTVQTPEQTVTLAAGESRLVTGPGGLDRQMTNAGSFLHLQTLP